MKVSIIIPIYNVAPFIEKCLQSVMSQTYRNIEVLLVDDCGTDNSMDIVKEMLGESEDVLLEGIHYRILHHTRNRGLSAARNTGIDAATGEWMFFLDSDDWITEDCIEKMITASHRHNNSRDMVMGMINQIGGRQFEDKFLAEGFYTDGFIEAACNYKIYTMAWNKLIRRSFIYTNNLFFVEGLIHEDILWNFEVACFLRSIEVINDKTYNYVIHDSSIQRDSRYEYHHYHESIVVVRLIQFIFKNHLENNITLYKYITNYSDKLLFDPLWTNRPELSRLFYKKLRKTPHWSIWQLLKFNEPLKRILMSFNFFLTERIGFSYIIKVYLA